MYNQTLNTFIEVADCGSFLKASEKLFISPTAIMKQMNLLEQHIGLSLMARTNQGIKLANAKESLCKDAKAIIQFSLFGYDSFSGGLQDSLRDSFCIRTKPGSKAVSGYYPLPD